MGRPIIQLKQPLSKDILPIGAWGVARTTESLEKLPELVRQSFDNHSNEDMQTRVTAMFSLERASPKVAAAIRNILAGREPSSLSCIE